MMNFILNIFEGNILGAWYLRLPLCAALLELGLSIVFPIYKSFKWQRVMGIFLLALGLQGFFIIFR